MEIIVTITVFWYAIGLLGSYLVCETFLRRSSDIDVSTICFLASTAIAGPINLIVGIIFAIGRLAACSVDLDRVVFKRKES